MSLAETIGEQRRPRIHIYMAGVEWGTRNWSAIPRVGDHITVLYRANRHAKGTPMQCAIRRIDWDEADLPVGAPVQQLVYVHADWPEGVAKPDFS